MSLDQLPHVHALLLAGGGGVRFWPLGRQARPKQFLPLVSDQTLLQETAARCQPLISADRTWVVTGRRYAEATAAQLPWLSPRHLIEEPLGRNTAPAIGLAAARVLAEDPRAVLIVLPADHAIAPSDAFQQNLATALEIIWRNPEGLVLLGAKPTEPATGFGYIEQGEPLGDLDAFRVRSFREKPPRETARQFLASGRHLWNCGIFVFRARRMLELLREHEPAIADGLDKISPAIGTDRFSEAAAAEFPRMPSIAIDKAVVERAAEVFVVPATCHWADVGTWQAWGKHCGTDENGNTVVGVHAGHDTHDCVIRTEGDHLVATAGIRDCIIVHTPDATLIARKDDEEGLRQLVALLEARGHGRFL